MTVVTKYDNWWRPIGGHETTNNWEYVHPDVCCKASGGHDVTLLPACHKVTTPLDSDCEWKDSVCTVSGANKCEYFLQDGTSIFGPYHEYFENSVNPDICCEKARTIGDKKYLDACIKVTDTATGVPTWDKDTKTCVGDGFSHCSWYLRSDPLQ